MLEAWQRPFIPGGPQTIQQAIDNANAGDLILVAPGTYSELVIMDKPVRLQGWGAGSTIINASPFPTDKLAAWRTKMATLYGTGFDPNRFMAKEGPGIMVLGDVPGAPAFGPGTLSRIDGFTITGSLGGGGIYLDMNAKNVQIANNKIKGNQGSWGGGITLGTQDLLASGNTDVVIQYNQIIKNSGRTGGGGISIYDGSDRYQVRNNFISGNFSSWNGAAVAHYGLNNGGLIQANKILYNEVFFGGAVGGEAGGIFIGGVPGRRRRPDRRGR